MDILLDFFSLDGNRIFLAAATVLFTLGVIEVLGLAIGASLSHALQVSLDSNGNGIPDFVEGTSMGSALGWLGFGKVPAMMVLALFLGFFSGAGFVINWISLSFLPHLLSPMITAPFAALIAIPPLRVAASTLARTIPQDFTSAIPVDEFVGCKAMIVTGDATNTLSAEAEVVDRFGTSHYVRVKPIDPAETIPCRTQVYLDKREANVFLVSRANQE